MTCIHDQCQNIKPDSSDLLVQKELLWNHDNCTLGQWHVLIGHTEFPKLCCHIICLCISKAQKRWAGNLLANMGILLDVSFSHKWFYVLKSSQKVSI